MVEVEEKEMKLPSTGILIIMGPSRCGKTMALAPLILNSSIYFAENPPSYWIVVYKYWQKAYEIIRNQLGTDRVLFVQNWHSNLLEELSITSRD